MHRNFAAAPRAVICDMDGLLVDSERLRERALLEAASSLELVLPLDSYREMVGRPWELHREFLLSLFDKAIVEQLKICWLRRFQEIAKSGLKLKPGVGFLLETCKSLDLKLGLCTSSERNEAVAHLDRLGIGRSFDVVVANGDYKRGKPSPEPYRLASEKLDVPVNFCIAIEDSPSGVRSAADAGMAVFMVPDIVYPTSETREICFVKESLIQVAGAIADLFYEFNGFACSSKISNF